MSSSEICTKNGRSSGGSGDIRRFSPLWFRADGISLTQKNKPESLFSQVFQTHWNTACSRSGQALLSHTWNLTLNFEVYKSGISLLLHCTENWKQSRWRKGRTKRKQFREWALHHKPLSWAAAFPMAPVLTSVMYSSQQHFHTCTCC